MTHLPPVSACARAARTAGELSHSPNQPHRLYEGRGGSNNSAGNSRRVPAPGPTTMTTTIDVHFPRVTEAEASQQVENELARLRTTRAAQRRRTRWMRSKLQRDEATIGLLTLNVNGLASKSDSMFTWLKRRTDVGSHDIVFLQETHAEQSRCETLADDYCGVWGYVPSRTRNTFSWWSGAEGLRGGLAILRRPGSSVVNVKPHRQHLWSSHWMAVTAVIHGVSTLLINVYAPHDSTRREAFFRELALLCFRHDGPILCGGDFNCTLHGRLDRSLQRTAGDHNSDELRRLLGSWDAVDVLQPELCDDDPDSTAMFQRSQHTYSYTVQGETHSSRLDRWYITADHARWVRHVQTVIPGAEADHDAVMLRVAAPHMRVHVRKPRRVYPVRACGYDIAKRGSAALFETLTGELTALETESGDALTIATDIARWWDTAKQRFKKLYIASSKEGAIKLKTSFRQRIRRLQAELAGGGIRDGVECSGSIRKEIVGCQTEWSEARTRQLRQRHTALPAEASKSFYARIATKYGDNTIVSLGPGTAGSSRRLADAMSNGWMPIMQQRQADAHAVSAYLADAHAVDLSEHLAILGDPITEEEVARAVARCKRHKARGPDELPNDWYRDHADSLVPLLLKMFKHWHATGVVPASFSEAHIQALKKHAGAATPLEHRPIALLNTDYKIYTRIFALRLRPLLPQVVHPLQAGFVPNRSIHSTIDLLHAAQALVNDSARQVVESQPRIRDADSVKGDANKCLDDAIVVLADFAKAYDSVNRDFLLAALRARGFPSSFVTTVSALHEKTSCAFLVNGFESKRTSVTCGIRQGCPLAPLLFIVMLDVLYRKIETDQELAGIPVPTEGGAADVRVSGYADDTALYLRSRSHVPAALRVLRDFGEVSGLHVNVGKSLVLPLGRNAIASPQPCDGMKVLGASETCRYLGIQVGVSDSMAANWSGCVAALRTRLRLAFDKTHSVTQRAEIARAVIVPKVLFIARHAWPSAAVVDELQAFTSSFVWGSRDGKRNRAWLSQEQAELPIGAGGIGFPMLRCELLSLAATAVAKWASNATDLERSVGDILIQQRPGTPVYVTSRHASKQTLRLGPSLWRSGVQAIESAHWLADDTREKTRITRTAAALSQVHLRSDWRNDEYVVDVGDDLVTTVTQHAQEASQLRGAFCGEWLACASTRSDGWLLDDRGGTFALSRLPLARGTTTLADILEWRLVRRGCVAFSYTPGHHSATAPTKRAFQRLCYTLLFNFPHMLLRPLDPHVLRPYSRSIQQHHSWRLDAVARMEHYDATLLTATHEVARSTGLDQDATSDVNRAEAVRFHATPRFSRLVQVWGGSERWKARRKQYYKHIAATRRRNGVAARDAALTDDDDGPVQRGVAELKWSAFKRLAGLNTYERQTAYRVKAGHIRCWNPTTDNCSCPMPDCTETKVTVEHIFWECSFAQQLWRTLARRWEALGVRVPEGDASSFFSMELPSPPRHAWSLLAASGEPQGGSGRLRQELQDCVYPAARALWQYTCGATLAAIWRARVAHLYDDEPATTAALHFAWLHRLKGGASLVGWLAKDVRDEDAGGAFIARRLAWMLFEDLPNEQPVANATSGRHEYVLFFDGGSRGNPGPGGSGSVIVQVGRHLRQAYIRWAASMAYGDAATTNNQAEYMGLLHGLRFAKKHGLEPLHVVGDSDMIIRQQREHRPPRNRRLRALFRLSTRLSDTMDVRSWSHHYRAHNKMADLAANQAMDSASSAQYTFPTSRAAGEELQRWLNNDVQHWFTQSCAFGELNSAP